MKRGKGWTKLHAFGYVIVVFIEAMRPFVLEALSRNLGWSPVVSITSREAIIVFFVYSLTIILAMAISTWYHFLVKKLTADNEQQCHVEKYVWAGVMIIGTVLIILRHLIISY